MSSGVKHIDGYDIHMKQMLGQGSFGAVYVGVNEKTQERVAIKVLKKIIDSDEYLKTALLNQIKIMETIKSQNIVGFYDVMESSNNYYIVQELCDGDLCEIMKPGHPVQQKTAIQYLRQMANGFLALVKEGVVHRDLKPANVMRKGKVLKIGDFGFAKKTEGVSCKKQTIVGTPLYMSLQVLKCEAYSSKCDIWALGFIFYEMLHGKTPWTGKSQFDLIKKIQTKPLEIDSSFSKNTIDFLKRSLGVYENRRMTWDQLFAHPIFQGYFSSQSNGKSFENKLKMVMTDLRFHINSNNLDLCIILAGLGYKGNEELNKDKFHEFLKIIKPSLNRQQSQYIFTQIDTEKKGSVTIKQIQNLMNQNKIGLRSIFQHIPGVKRTQTMGSSSGSAMDASTEKKVRTCFRKLLDILRAQNKILYDVFKAFDKEKSGSLNRNQFKNMLKYLSTDINDEEINAAFDHIDSAKREKITFDDLNSYFSKVNGIPEHLNKPHDPKNSVGQPAAFFQQMFNPGYAPYYYPQYYQPPHPSMYQGPPPPGYQYPQKYPNYPPNYGPYGQPGQPGSQGFVLDQLSQNMNKMGSNMMMQNNANRNSNSSNTNGSNKPKEEKKKKKGWW